MTSTVVIAGKRSNNLEKKNEDRSHTIGVDRGAGVLF